MNAKCHGIPIYLAYLASRSWRIIFSSSLLYNASYLTPANLYTSTENLSQSNPSTCSSIPGKANPSYEVHKSTPSIARPLQAYCTFREPFWDSSISESEDLDSSILQRQSFTKPQPHSASQLWNLLCRNKWGSSTMRSWQVAHRRARCISRSCFLAIFDLKLTVDLLHWGEARMSRVATASGLVSTQKWLTIQCIISLRTTIDEVLVDT